MFLICKSIYLLWRFIQYLIHRDKTLMLKRASSDKTNLTKNAIFSLLLAPTHHSFTFNSQFLYVLRHMAHLSKPACGILFFRFCLISVKLYIFVQQKPWTLWLQNVIISFKIKIIEKSHEVLLPDLWFLSCTKKFENSRISAWVAQKLTWSTSLFLNRNF